MPTLTIYVNESQYKTLSAKNPEKSASANGKAILEDWCKAQKEAQK